MASILIILNGPPYGTEHSYNGLRLAGREPDGATVVDVGPRSIGFPLAVAADAHV